METNVVEGSCCICGQASIIRCSWDGKLFCSHEHRNWLHDSQGKCFQVEIKQLPYVGRYLVATKDYEPGELIHEENALAVGPNPISTPQCLECGSKISDWQNAKTCDCGYLKCDKCSTFAQHNQKECTLLKALLMTNRQSELAFKDLVVANQGRLPNYIYEPILPMRCLLTKWNNSPHFNFLMTLMDHEDDRKNDDNGEYWKHSSSTVIGPLLQAFKSCNYDVDFDEIAKVVGICEVNNYEICNPDGSTGVRGLFPVTSLMSHSCMPNCRIVVEREKPFHASCVASQSIKNGQELTITYANLLLPTYLRRESLQENWYFQCSCLRCLDRTELGSYVGAVRCPRCAEESIDSYLLANPASNDGLWTSDECPHNLEAQNAKEIVESLSKKTQDLSPTDIEGHKVFLKEAEKIVHPNHYLLTRLRRRILPLMSRDPTKSNRTEYIEKIEMASSLRSTFELIMSPFSKDRGRAAFELAEALLNVSKLDYNSGVIAYSDFQRSLQLGIIALFEEASKILQIEPEGTFDHSLFKASEFYVAELKKCL